MKTKRNPEEDWLLISWLSLQIASPRTVTLLTPGLIPIRFRCTAPAGPHLHGTHSQWWQPAALVLQMVWEPAKWLAKRSQGECVWWGPAAGKCWERMLGCDRHELEMQERSDCSGWEREGKDGGWVCQERKEKVTLVGESFRDSHLGEHCIP